MNKTKSYRAKKANHGLDYGQIKVENEVEVSNEGEEVCIYIKENTEESPSKAKLFSVLPSQNTKMFSARGTER